MKLPITLAISSLLIAGAPAWGAGATCVQALQESMTQLKNDSLELKLNIYALKESSQELIQSNVTQSLLAKSSNDKETSLDILLMNEQTHFEFIQLVGAIAKLQAESFFLGTHKFSTDEEIKKVDELAAQVHSQISTEEVLKLANLTVKAFFLEQSSEILLSINNFKPEVRSEFSDDIDQFLNKDLSAEEHEQLLAARLENNDLNNLLLKLIRKAKNENIPAGFVAAEDVPAPKKKSPIGFVPVADVPAPKEKNPIGFVWN